jgi:predicted ATP-dependent endonuclease of OLD family
MGEFANVIPSVEFSLPDEEVIAKEMKIFLDDGHRSEIEQKGHGLQRAILLAMLRVLAKHGTSYVDKPTPLFLIGEIETFLHPFAQKQLAEALDSLTSRYQVITSTHSPFIISPKTISGYKRVMKDDTKGTKHISCDDSIGVDHKAITRHLERRGNLEGLFADRVILIEGDHDQGFYTKLCTIFNIQFPTKKFTLFIKTNGKQELRQARLFYKKMGFEDVSVISDLDYMFSCDFKHLLESLGLDVNLSEKLRKHIEFDRDGDPSLEYVVEKNKGKDEPEGFDDLLKALEKERIFVLRKGSPEQYYKAGSASKSFWDDIGTKDDLLDAGDLESLMKTILA